MLVNYKSTTKFYCPLHRERQTDNISGKSSGNVYDVKTSRKGLIIVLFYIMTSELLSYFKVS